MRELLTEAARRAIAYLEGLEARGVAPSADALARLRELDVALPDDGMPPEQVLKTLDEVGSPAAVGSAGSRYFGFVIGGSMPAALAANWLASTWDQNAALVAASPIAAKLEEVAGRWLLEVLDLPRESGVAFVTGATMANFASLAAARHALLKRKGWDVEAQGLFGAPEITVVVGQEAHASLLKALSMVGLGRERVVRVPVDEQGRMRVDAMPTMHDMTLLCLQAGNVNTGAFDPAAELIERARNAGAWVHVDGAFGLWARACPSRAQLGAGLEQADSWATDAHKWLNVPYDSGLAFVRNAEDLRAAMSTSAAYLLVGDTREPSHYTPELSRRARGADIWAGLLSIGKKGLAGMIEQDCRLAERMAGQLRGAGFRILNEVCLNQILVSFGDAERTKQVISSVQQDGTAWCGGTVWQGQTAMRISVSSWATTEEDADRSVEAIVRAAKAVPA
ncbi:MAG: pyridoxal phosphate-dependent decarboxylase family protein [Anaerolineae bacterium]